MTEFLAISVVNMIVASRLFPGICRLEWKVWLKFLGLMVAVTAIRVIFFKVLSSPPIDEDTIRTISMISWWKFLLVFWEDAFFTLPALVLSRMGISKFNIGAMLVLSSITFASGHLAYGLPWAFITLFYVPLLSYKYGKKYGLGTVQACHISYDIITFFTMVTLLKG